MADMQDLLARLKMPNATGSFPSPPPVSAQRSTTTLHQPQPQSASISQTLFSSVSPSIQEMVTAEQSSFNVRNSTSTDAPTHQRTSSDRAANLLNLLKFNSNARSPSLSLNDASGADDSTRSPNTSIPLNAVQASKVDLPSIGQRAITNSQQTNTLLQLLQRAGNEEETKPFISNAATPPVFTRKASAQILASEAQRDGSAPSKPASPFGDPSLQGSQFTFVSPFEKMASALPSSPMAKSANQPPISTPSNTATAIATPVADSSFLQSVESPAPPSPLPDGRTRVEALIGIGARPIQHESVASALDALGQRADMQAENALRKAQAEVVDAKTTKQEPTDVQPLDEGSKAADAWETDEAEDNAGVKVYNLPMRPFVAIDVKSTPGPSCTIRQDIIMKIANLKKEFDQVDRTLVSATTNFIVYSIAKGGGFRVIRQDDGMNKQAFKRGGDHIFNVSVRPSSSAEPAHECVLATSANGSVIYTTVPTIAEGFEDLDLEGNGFIFPPVPFSDEANTSGGQLKTRAKQSSKHSDMFAVGRGKAIHLISAKIVLDEYTNSVGRIADSERYLSERCLKIATGKAGKDFAFSEDDTMIVSLDKAGRLKFWDIRKHLENSSYTVNTPTMTLHTGTEREKSWATSVHFMDKEKAYSKGIALRYLLVGLRQNHTLQLWDLCLKKPVQELNLPHEHENDPICSIAYHPKSGIIVVGHPKRNSLYLVHLSTPKYNIHAISQAQFTLRLMGEDGKKLIPRPDSTAIMSGIREISLGSVGQLRSLDIINPITTQDGSKAEETLFELYIMHARGVASVSVKRQDLGWDDDGKVIKTYDAENEQLIEVNALDAYDPVQGRTSVETNDSKPESVSKIPAGVVAIPQLKTGEDQARKPLEKSIVEQKELPEFKPSSYASAAQKATTAVPQKAVSPMKTTATFVTPSIVSGETVNAVIATAPVQAVASDPAFGTALSETLSSAIGSTLSRVLSEVLGDQFADLYERIEQARRVQEAAGAANQDAILRLVSSTLTDNVEKNLTRIVNTSITDKVMPQLSVSLSADLGKVVANTLSSQIEAIIPREVRVALIPAIETTLQDVAVLKSISESIVSKIMPQLEQQLAVSMRDTISPSFQMMAATSAQKAVVEVEKRVQSQLTQFEARHQEDIGKTQQLTEATQELLTTVRTISEFQLTMQEELVALHKAVLASPQRGAFVEVTAGLPTMETEEQKIVRHVTDLVKSNRMEEATIRWLQSPEFQTVLWATVFVHVDPSFLQACNQIVALSVAATVSASFDNTALERISWLETALRCIDTQDPEVTAVVPSIMEVLIQRMQAAYMQIGAKDAQDPSLVKLHSLARRAKDLITSCA